MKVDVLKRLKRLENRIQSTEFPDLVIICYDKKTEKWKVQETYCKHDSKGNIVTGSGKEKVFLIDDYNQYEPPEGFNGTIIIDTMDSAEYDEAEKQIYTRAIIKA